MLEDVCNPLGIPLVVLLAANGFNVFGMCKKHIAGLFKYVIHGNPVLTRGFHTDVLQLLVLSQSANRRKSLVNVENLRRLYVVITLSSVEAMQATIKDLWISMP